MAVITERGFSPSLPSNMQQCLGRAGIWEPTKHTEKGEAFMFLSYFGILDEAAKFSLVFLWQIRAATPHTCSDTTPELRSLSFFPQLFAKIDGEIICWHSHWHHTSYVHEVSTTVSHKIKPLTCMNVQMKRLHLKISVKHLKAFVV